MSTATNSHECKRIECLLKLENEPIELKQIAKATNMDVKKVVETIDTINKQYEAIGSVLRIQAIETAFSLGINKKFKDEPLSKFYANNKQKKISQATLETLAIIAYRQPITKTEIDTIRGVKSEHHLKILMEQELIRISGKKDVVGKPLIYRTTLKFLQQFNLSAINELPPLKEVKEYDFLKKQELNL